MSDTTMDEIKQIFEAECIDGLDVIEAGLLALENGDDNLDTVNDIFRGAHSIKGGAATFGYSNIATFTHEMETLLDQVRAEELAVSPALVKLFLDAVDCLRAMVGTMDGGSYDEERTEEVKEELKLWINKSVESEAEENGVIEEHEKVKKGWNIQFKPHHEFLQSGNQPQHIFCALSDLGKTTLKADLSKLPGFADFDPVSLYIHWDIDLDGDVSQAQILEEFDWVDSVCTVITQEKNDEAVKVASTDDQNNEIVAESKDEVAMNSEAERTTSAKLEEYDRRAESRRTETTEDRREDTPRRTAKKPVKKGSGSIRVDIDKVDVLLNLVGEMVINQSILNQLNRKMNDENASAGAELSQGLILLERTTRELQEAVMQIRMLPVSSTFNRYPRLVYDLSSKLNKKVELEITGEGTELDKTVLEKIGDPLLHLIRNSLDHGIEMPQERIAAGKEETGTIYLSAAHEGSSVIIRVRDDGAGLNTDRIRNKAIEKGLIKENDNLTEQQINNLIFRAGFSTADVVTDLSGRGVGMDVVRSNIEDIGGRVEVHSERGKGSNFQIVLPLTLAIMDGQLIQVDSEVYVIPLLSIVETVQVNMDKLNIISGQEVVYRLRDEAIPVVDMRTVCRVPGEGVLESFKNKQLVVVESNRKPIGLIVDSLLDQHQVVIKSLETNFVRVPGMLGATILGDGKVSLILDTSNLTAAMSGESFASVEH